MCTALMIRESYSFIEKVYDKIFELKDDHPDAFVILGGDFNVCLTENDSLNWLKTRQEKLVTDYITSSNATANLIDTYRSMEEEGGYTHGEDEEHDEEVNE